MLRLATWNVNSVRAREERVTGWLDRSSADVVCLQEIKVETAAFPYAVFEERGYQAAVHGQKTYNGVAVLSKRPIVTRATGLPGEEEARFLHVETAGLDVLSVYVPNGREVGSEAWAYKLAWMDKLITYVADLEVGPLVVCGDLNIAPEDRDVAEADAWRGSVLFHERLSEALARLLQTGLIDVMRLFHEGKGPYTWWDYRRLAFPRGDGLRIDHILARPSLAERAVEATVDRDERKGVKPSDHAPVVVALDL